MADHPNLTVFLLVLLLLIVGGFTGHTKRLLNWFLRLNESYKRATYQPHHWVQDDIWRRMFPMPDLSGLVWMTIAVFMAVVLGGSLLDWAVRLFE